MTNFLKKFLIRNIISKGERLIYIVILLWVIYGALAIWQGMNLAQLAGYYASLTLFISTYLWGEFRRTSKSTALFTPGHNSSREVIIYVVLLLWCVLGAFGIFLLDEMNSLTVYFGSLSPFVMSYIIFKTSKGTDDLPIFDGKSQELIDKAHDSADYKTGKVTPKKPVIKEEPKDINTKEPKDNEDFTGYVPEDDEEGDVDV
jgi:hypothetical protein